MGHTNSTTNYNLPQFITTDKPAWLTDINGAFSAIDSGLHTAQSDATTAGTNAAQALLDASAASTAASTADAKGAGAVASIAAAFDATETYAVGDKVMYSNLLYVCTVAVTTPGAWTGSTNWSRTTVNGIIPASSSDLPFIAGGPDGSTGHAIDERVRSTTDSPMLKTKNFSASYTVAGSSSVNISGTQLQYTAPTGYQPIALYSVYTGSGDVVMKNYFINETGAHTVINLRNLTTSSITASVSIDVLYAKNSCFGIF